MLALKSVKDILKFMGLVSDAAAAVNDRRLSYSYYVRNILITIPMVVLLMPLCAYFVYHANDLVHATEVFYVIAATILCIGQYWFLVWQREPLENLISELQTLIDQSKNDFFIFLYHY